MDDRPKKPTSAEILSQVERKDNNEPDKGGGNPHMNWDDKPLSESETWKSHKPAKQVKPPKKQA